MTFDHSPISVGWNGAEPGAPHCTGNDCPGMTPGLCPSIHAERNALRKAESILRQYRRSPVDLYVTHSPCEVCTVLILGSTLSVRRVFFETPYRQDQHLEMLQRENIEVYEITPASYIVDHFSRRVVELP